MKANDPFPRKMHIHIMCCIQYPGGRGVGRVAVAHGPSEGDLS